MIGHSKKLDKMMMLIWVYSSFLLSFNELLALAFPKTITRGICIFLIACGLFSCLKEENWRIEFDNESTLVFVYLAYVLCRGVIQIIGGNITSATSVSFGQTLVPIFVFFIARQISRHATYESETVFCAFSDVSILMGLVDSHIHFLPSIGSFSGGLYANVGNVLAMRSYSMAGNALVTGFIGTLSICFVISNRNKIFKYITIIIGIYGVLSSLSRGAFAMLIIFLFSYFVCNVISSNRMVKKRTFLATLVVVIIVVTGILMNLNRITSSTAFGRLFKVGLSSSDGSNSYRTLFHRMAISAIAQNPIFGKGFGFTGYQAIQNNVNGYINTESYILSLAICIGIVGLILFLVITAYALIASFVNVKSSCDGKEYKYACIVLGILIWSFMYIILDSDLNAIFFWYCIGKIWNRNCQ